MTFHNRCYKVIAPVTFPHSAYYIIGRKDYLAVPDKSPFEIHALTLAVIGICVIFFINLIKGIRHEELFPKKNIRLIFIAAILLFLQTVASDNLDQAFISEGPAVIDLTSNPFVQSLILLVFGILYKMGYQVAAEHDLTV